MEDKLHMRLYKTLNIATSQYHFHVYLADKYSAGYKHYIVSTIYVHCADLT